MSLRFDQSCIMNPALQELSVATGAIIHDIRSLVVEVSFRAFNRGPLQSACFLRGDASRLLDVYRWKWTDGG